MTEQFLDTNILLRHLLQDVPDQSPRATEYIRHIENGDVRAHISDIVVFEVTYTLTRSYRLPRAEVRDAVLAILDLPGIILPGKRRFHRVFDLYVDLNISFADAYHVVLMEQQKLTEVVTFDRDFDRAATVRRIEP